MAITVLLILVAMWAAVLVPPILRARSVQRSGDTIGDFRYRLNVLGNRAGRRQHQQPARGTIDSLARLQAPGASLSAAPVVAPSAGSMSPVQRRRRDVFLGLAGATGFMFLLALVTGSLFFWFLWLVSASALGGYVYLLLRLKQTAAERVEKVRPLAGRRPAPLADESQLALSRTAGS